MRQIDLAAGDSEASGGLFVEEGFVDPGFVAVESIRRLSLAAGAEDSRKDRFVEEGFVEDDFVLEETQGVRALDASASTATHEIGAS